MKKFSYIILSLLLVFAPAYAYANTSIGGWTLTDSIIAGANTTIEATKTAGGKAVKSTVTVAASAAKVGKHLIKGGGQAALAYAVVELLGEGIDWVLDPANNSVRYKDPTAADGTDTVGGVSGRWCAGQYCSGSPQAAATMSLAALGYKTSPMDCSLAGDKDVTVYYCIVPGVADASVFFRPVEGAGGGGSDSYKSIPIQTVAAKVISNAEAGHGPSQEAVKATALEGFAAGELDASLDANAKPADAADTDVPADPANPADPNAPPAENPALEFPAFCTWASPVCLFFSWARQEVSELVVTITALKDWVFEEAPPEKDVDNTLDTKPIPLTPTQVAINFVGSCPAPLTFEYKIYNQTFRPAVPFDPLCKIAILINPVIKICASIAAIYIVAGIRQGNS